MAAIRSHGNSAAEERFIKRSGFATKHSQNDNTPDVLFAISYGVSCVTTDKVSNNMPLATAKGI